MVRTPAPGEKFPRPTMGRPDVIVAGGGLAGAACARMLAQRGRDVLLVDSGKEDGRASGAAAGMLAPLAEAHEDDPLFGLSIRARDLYRDLAPVLKEETGIDIGLWTDGIAHVALDDEEAERLRDEVAWQRQRGSNTDWLPAEDLRQRYPGITPDAVGGKLAGEDGALDPNLLRKALLQGAKRAGASIERGRRVEAVLIEDGAVRGVRAGGADLASDAVIVAAGAWSGRIAGLPRPLSIEPIRGQIVALPWPEGEPASIVYGAGGYVLHRGGEALVGTTMEHVGFDTSVTKAATGKVLASARMLYPALADVSATRSWAGLRPCTPDGQPMVGRDADVDGLWYATGHGRNGVLLAALTGEIVAALFDNEPIDYDLSAMDPARFWRL